MKLMDEFKDLFQNEIKSYLKKKIYLFFSKGSIDKQKRL